MQESLFQIFSSRNEAVWDTCIYPVPKSIIPVVPSISEMVDKQTAILGFVAKEEIQSAIPLMQPKNNQPDKGSSAQKHLEITELLAVLLIFCLIFFTLSVMWENLGATLTVGGFCFPVLKYFGKI